VILHTYLCFPIASTIKYVNFPGFWHRHQITSTMPSRRSDEDRDPARVFLGNLPHDTRERDIERFFDKYGRVYNIFIKNGKYGFCDL